MLKLLLVNGADANVTDKDGYNACTFAAGFGNVTCLKLLIDHGADLNAADNDGLAPLDIAKEHENDACVALLEARLFACVFFRLCVELCSEAGM